MRPPAMTRPAEIGRRIPDARAKAEQTAAQFEALLVRQLVGSLRQSSSIGEGGGMFSGGLGSDTYTDWFDQHMADQIGSSGNLGIKEEILRDLERYGQLPQRPDAPTHAEQAAAATSYANRAAFTVASARQGGIDVTQ